jgi:hypothetical protein
MHGNKPERHEVTIRTVIDLPAKAQYPSDDKVREAVNETLRGMFARRLGGSIIADKWGESAPCPKPPNGPGGTCWMEVGPVTK